MRKQAGFGLSVAFAVIQVFLSGKECLGAEKSIAKITVVAVEPNSDAPTVTSIAPVSGPVGTVVTVTGGNFAGVTGVSVSETAIANFGVVSENVLIVEIPAAAATGQIGVTNTNGTGLSFDDFIVVAPPVLNSFVPASGPAGIEVTIAGNNLASVTDTRFSGASSFSFVADSDTIVRAIVPPTASTGRIEITNAAGTDASTSTFSVIESPDLLRFTATDDAFVKSTEAARNYGGQEELIVRENSVSRVSFLKFQVTGLFGVIGSARVRLLAIDGSDDGGSILAASNSYKGTTSPWTEDDLAWRNSPAISGAVLSDVQAVSLNDTVEFDVTSAITGNGLFSFVIQNDSPDAAIYSSKEGVAAPELVIEMTSSLPAISTFFPARAGVGAWILIEGNNFNGASGVSFDSTPAEITIDSDQQIRAQVPVGATTGKLAIENGNGESISAKDFVVIDPPQIVSFTPRAGENGARVTIVGRHFSSATVATFSGVPGATFVVDSDTLILAEVPANAPTGAIGVTNLAATTLSADRFRVLYPPVVSSFTPETGVSGQEIVIIGENFVGASGVAFAGQSSADFTVISASQIRASVPSGVATSKILVTNADGTRASRDDFVVIQPPSISGFQPASGPVGSEVTIIGENFIQLDTLTFSGVVAPGFTVECASRLRVRVPSGPTDGPLRIVTVAGAATSASEFTLTFEPVITSLEPLNGVVGTEVTITGENLADVTSVAFNGTAVTSVTLDSAGRIHVYVPEGATTGRLRLTNNHGTGESVGDFVVIQPPFVSGFEPANGPPGAEVTIAGTGFDEVSAVSFGGISASNFEVDSAIQIRAWVPTGFKKAAITVVNVAGEATSLSTFQVILHPVVTSFEPQSGGTGTAVIVAGQNFDEATAVSFGGISAAFFEVQSDSQVVVTVPTGAQTGPVAVSNVVGVGRSAEDFTIPVPPTLDSFHPLAGPPRTAVTIRGQDLENVTQVAFNGVFAGIIAIDSEAEMRVSVPSGATSGPIKVSNDYGEDSSASDFTVVIQASTRSFLPTEDAFVRDNKSKANYGDSEELRVRRTSSSEMVSFLKFNVSGTAGPIESAKLRLLVVDASADGGSLYSVSSHFRGATSPWVEEKILPRNAPEIVGKAIASAGFVAIHETVEFDLGAAVTGDGVYSFAIMSRSNDVVKYGSKEGVQPPELVVKTSGSIFEVPEIETVEPNSGIVGTEVTISGRNLTGISQARFGGVLSSHFVAYSNREVRATVPQGATTGKISLTNLDGTGLSDDDFTVISRPELFSFQPARGPAGTEVTLSGNNLAAVEQVCFGAVPATRFEVSSDSEIVAEAPATRISGPIGVINAAGADTSASTFTVTIIPVVSSFSPPSGLVGAEVTVHGSNFDDVNHVSFNGVAANGFSVESTSKLLVVVPPDARSGKLEIENPDGTTRSAAEFVVWRAPQITTFAPTSGPVGTEVTLVGSSFAGATEISFNGSAASTFVLDSDSRLRVPAPAGVTSGPIAIRNPAGIAVTSKDFGVVAAPISAVFNATADAYVRSNKPGRNYGSSRDLVVRKAGSDYEAYFRFEVAGLTGAARSATLRLYVRNASDDGGELYRVADAFKNTNTPWDESGLNYDNAPSIVGEPVASLADVASGDTVELDVTEAIVGDGVYSFALRSHSKDRVSFSSKEGSHPPQLTVEFLSTPVPTILSFSPSVGLPGTEVEIVGLNFATLSEVTFNGAPASAFFVDSDTHIRAIVPSGATTGKLTLVNQDGTGASKSVFRIPAPPVIHSFTPDRGPVGAQVTVSGTNLSEVSTVFFGEIEAGEPMVDSDKQVRFEVPDRATTNRIRVVSTAGTAESAKVFNVTPTPLPTISGFAPAAGAYGTEVTIAGQGFSSADKVAFNGVPATVFQLDSDIQVRASVPSGSLSGKISVSNSAGVGVSASEFEVVARPTVIEFMPTDDTFTKSTKQTKTYGSAEYLKVTSKGTLVAFLKFRVDGLTGSASRAMLRLKVTSSSDDGGAIFLVSNYYKSTTEFWREKGLKGRNAPSTAGIALDKLGEVRSGDTVEFDLSGVVTSDGTYSFCIQSGSENSVKYSSKEGSDPPRLVVEAAAALSKTSSEMPAPPRANGPLPDEPVFRPNFPNPFNGSTQIEFVLSRAGQVDLTIFNLLGQLVRPPAQRPKLRRPAQDHVERPR